MKKKPSTKSSKAYKANETVSMVSEPYIIMQSINKFPAALADFPYSKFKKIADKISFTQVEWASILHLSERTLQRYSKDDKSFEGIYVDRILQLEKLIDTGLETFESTTAFYNWLKTPKTVLGTLITFESLYHSQGIQEIYQQLQRIQQGVYT
jgi:putative toxin-antitoxin system antitoxin component (TIGR02293 family)